MHQRSGEEPQKKREEVLNLVIIRTSCVVFSLVSCVSHTNLFEDQPDDADADDDAQKRRCEILF